MNLPLLFSSDRHRHSFALFPWLTGIRLVVERARELRYYEDAELLKCKVREHERKWG